MKKSDIYEVAIKILGLYLFFTAIGLLREVLSSIAVANYAKQHPAGFDPFNQAPFLVLSIANFVLVLIFAAFLTFKTREIVKLVCSQADYTETSTLFADRRVIYEISLLIMGLLLILWSIPDLAFRLKNYLQHVQTRMPIRESDSSFIITASIKLMAGLIAVLYSKRIARFLVKDKSNTKTDV